ncbi:putative nuclease activity [Lyophyllum shimeji]|uniref:Nuclease activity n=1 Tax=Lyophyllum shimeji TaxID=47721 RepID=A0A9P3PQ62_LYOSH|nr:putative nuclease activity [Lyophyllum shimeji]
MRALPTLRFRQENTILQMQDLVFAMRFWFLIAESDIIWLNGVVLVPANKEELYNLRHAQARNIIERIFGVLKARWAILTRAPQYDMDLQARIPPGLAAMHNFIMTHDPTDIEAYLDDPDLIDPQPGAAGDVGVLAEGYVNRTERERATATRDSIAQAMWNQYQQYLCEHPEITMDD